MKWTKICLVTTVSLTLAACAKNDSPVVVNQEPVYNTVPSVQMDDSSEEKLCKTEIVVASSSQNFIRFSHPTRLIDEVGDKAAAWCAQYNKSSSLRKQKCGVCCTTNYFCNWSNSLVIKIPEQVGWHQIQSFFYQNYIIWFSKNISKSAIVMNMLDVCH